MNIRIGEFAKLHNVSIDTIRHYMDKGLVIPLKVGGQYRFDENCQKDMVLSIEMKEFGFTIEEIRLFMFYKRASMMKEMEQDVFIYKMIEFKYKEIQLELEKYQKMDNKLKQKLEARESKPISKYQKTGIALKSMSLFVCPKCQGELSLNCSEVVNNAVINGELVCTSCSESMIIDDGIIKTKDYLMPSYDFNEQNSDNEITNLFSDYVKHTPASYFETAFYGMKWLKDHIDFKVLSDKNILEIGSGSGLFLRHIYEELPEDSTYICIDHNHQMNMYLKEIIEAQSNNKNIIYISCDFMHIPLRQGIVDTIVDMTGVSNYNLNFGKKKIQSFLLEDIQALYKPNVWIYGFYFLFQKFGLSHKEVDPINQSKFKANYIIRSLEKIGFHIENSFDSEILPTGGKYEDFFDDEDKVYAKYIVAQKR